MNSWLSQTLTFRCFSESNPNCWKCFVKCRRISSDFKLWSSAGRSFLSTSAPDINCFQMVYTQFRNCRRTVNILVFNLLVSHWVDSWAWDYRLGLMCCHFIMNLYSICSRMNTKVTFVMLSHKLFNLWSQDFVKNFL